MHRFSGSVRTNALIFFLRFSFKKKRGFNAFGYSMMIKKAFVNKTIRKEGEPWLKEKGANCSLLL
jgi:hypothetical protein